MSVNWSKEKMKQYLLFTHQAKVMIKDKQTQLELEMEVDCLNNHVTYNITNGCDIEYYSFDDINDAIDKFYEMKDEEGE